MGTVCVSMICTLPYGYNGLRQLVHSMLSWSPIKARVWQCLYGPRGGWWLESLRDGPVETGWGVVRVGRGAALKEADIKPYMCVNMYAGSPSEWGLHCIASGVQTRVVTEYVMMWIIASVLVSQRNLLLSKRPRRHRFLYGVSKGRFTSCNHEVGPWKMVFSHGPTWWSNFHGLIYEKNRFTKRLGASQ